MTGSDSRSAPHELVTLVAAIARPQPRGSYTPAAWRDTIRQVADKVYREGYTAGVHDLTELRLRPISMVLTEDELAALRTQGRAA